MRYNCICILYNGQAELHKILLLHVDLFIGAFLVIFCMKSVKIQTFLLHLHLS